MLQSFTKNLAHIKANKLGSGEISQISDAILAAGIHITAARMSLPIYAQSFEMLEALRHNDVLAVPSDTGSGKSTILPMLLIAEYGTCSVTQPRIAPCKRTAEFVGKTFSGICSVCGLYRCDKGCPARRTPCKFERFVGCEWSGHENTDKHARLMYLTDGLLAMRVCYLINKLIN